MTDLPGDAIKTTAAARLLGITPTRIQQLVRDGRATSPARGHVNLASLLRGYVCLLREDADRPASAALSKGQTAQAALIEDRAAHRRAGLITRQEAEEVLDTIASISDRHIATLQSGRGRTLQNLPAPIREAIRTNAAEARRTIAAARLVAVGGLVTGEFEGVGS